MKVSDIFNQNIHKFYSRESQESQHYATTTMYSDDKIFFSSLFPPHIFQLTKKSPIAQFSSTHSAIKCFYCHSYLQHCHITVRKCAEATHSIKCDDNSLKYRTASKCNAQQVSCWIQLFWKFKIESLHENHVSCVTSQHDRIIVWVFSFCFAAFTW